MSEFDIIRQYFTGTAIQRNDVVLGIGDDCALLAPQPGKQLAISTDTLISGVHFPAHTTPFDIGYKSLAVNLSDLAAMGAEPAWVSLAISLPEENTDWLSQFMLGFNQLAQQYQLSLVGGDTTRGPLSISLTVIGYSEADKSLRRDQAEAGDALFVTGTLGDARYGLQAVQEGRRDSAELEYCIQRLNKPTARVEAGLLLKDYSRCAIDLSDGLLSDLQHICQASQVGARIQLEQIPLSQQLKDCYADQIDWQAILNAGDDYELCFTVKQDVVSALTRAFDDAGIPICCIGEITQEQGIKCYHEQRLADEYTPGGYDHFEE